MSTVIVVLIVVGICCNCRNFREESINIQYLFVNIFSATLLVYTISTQWMVGGWTIRSGVGTYMWRLTRVSFVCPLMGGGPDILYIHSTLNFRKNQ